MDSMNATHLFVLYFFCSLTITATASDSTVYEQQVVEDPYNYRAVYNAGVAAFKENKLERAQSCFNLLKTYDYTQADLREHAVPIFYNAGNTEYQLQNYEDALKSFEKVLEYNPDHELARKKYEHIKKLLEQQKQQQEQEKKQDKNQEQHENQDDKKQQDQDTSQQQEPQKQHDNQNDSDNNNQKTEKNRQEQQKKHQENKEENSKPEKSEEKAAPDISKEEQLTQEEQQILAAVQDLDENMHKALEKQKIQQAQGVHNARNNW